MEIIMHIIVSMSGFIVGYLIGCLIGYGLMVLFNRIGRR